MTSAIGAIAPNRKKIQMKTLIQVGSKARLLRLGISIN
jgi:hypothetical protein